MRQVFKVSIIIPFIALQLIVNGQTVDSDSLTTKEFNDHVVLLLKNKKIYKKFLQQDEHGDSTIYVNVERFQNLNSDEPFFNNEVKYYYWSVENLFFFNISSPWLEVLKISHNYFTTRYTFIADNLYIEMHVVHYDMIIRKSIPPVISGLKISKIKRLD